MIDSPIKYSEICTHNMKLLVSMLVWVCMHNFVLVARHCQLH